MWHSNGGGNFVCYQGVLGGGCDGDKGSENIDGNNDNIVNNGNESDGVVDKDNVSVNNSSNGAAVEG